MTTPARRRLALLGIALAIAAQAGLPALHVLVHRLERVAAVAAMDPAGWRVEARRSRAAERPAPAERGHEHPGDRPREHGASALEHLTVALMPAPPVILPCRREHLLASLPSSVRASVAAVPVPSRDRNRGPPATA